MNKARHPDAALVNFQFLSPEGEVAINVRRIERLRLGSETVLAARTAVVGAENDDRLLVESRGLQRPHNVPDHRVRVSDHPGEGLGQ